MAEIDEDFETAGAQIIWVLEQDPSFGDGTAENCIATMEELGATTGWCVGDDETLPEADVWDDSDLANNRGFDIIVPRDTMVIEWVSTHGTGPADENPDAEDVLAEVQALLGR